MTATLSHFYLELNGGITCLILGPLGSLNRSRQFQNLKVKYNFFFLRDILWVTVVIA